MCKYWKCFKFEECLYAVMVKMFGEYSPYTTFYLWPDDNMLLF